MKRHVSIAFFDTKPYDRQYFEKANASFGYSITFFEPHLTAETAPLTRGFDVVCAFVNDAINASTAKILIDNGIKLIAMRCAGYNNVDLKAVWEKVHVVRVPAYSPYSVAEHATALLLSLTRRIPQAYNRTRDGNFILTGLTGRDLHGRTAGIIGTGKIGKIMAGILRGMGMSVITFDKFPDAAWAETEGVTYTDIETLCSTADVISLHSPLTPETHHIINEHTLSRMKKDAVIINTGRGALIDTPALVEALKEGRIGGAGLDVYEEEDEYFFEDWSLLAIQDDVLARLLSFPNVIVTGHQAFLTNEALESIAQTTLENIRLFFFENKLPNEICYKCDSKACRKKETGRCF